MNLVTAFFPKFRALFFIFWKRAGETSTPLPPLVPRLFKHLNSKFDLNLNNRFRKLFFSSYIFLTVKVVLRGTILLYLLLVYRVAMIGIMKHQRNILHISKWRAQALHKIRSSHPRCFIKKAVLQNFATFTNRSLLLTLKYSKIWIVSKLHVWKV